MAGQEAAATDSVVIFGITGDLARKMTFRALYRLERRNLLEPDVGHPLVTGIIRMDPK